MFDYSALHLLYDAPRYDSFLWTRCDAFADFSERLFRQLESSNERFEVKLLHQDMISRLIGLHHLLLLNFYPYLQRYLQPHQRQVTKILLYLAQASHPYVPPDILQSLCKTIANQFITERKLRRSDGRRVRFFADLISTSSFVFRLNTIREVCSRCYLAMDEDLLQDLSKYKSYRDKSVSAAARSLIQLFREKNPFLLERKDRGKPTEFQREVQPLDYGQINPKSYLEGAELLDGEQQDEDEEEEEVDEEEGEEDWVNVSHSEDEEEKEEEEQPKVGVRTLSIPVGGYDFRFRSFRKRNR